MSNIRLVIWDLDETFWKGTLTEGGIQEYLQSHHDIVIELARRGIISSICSKNNLDDVKPILEEKGIWDYFVFPSIDWTAKGPRLKEMINDVQLRPENILFIDDNPSNRAEALAHIPDLQVSDESIISTLLTSELLQGKNDLELSRLKQYQLLQRRKTDAKNSNVDSEEFLKSSNIYVTIEPDIEPHLDRVVELINRTNQLNFTKNRLPDDAIEAAKEAVRKFTSRYFAQTGLIRARDKYGDYGFCGFYVTFSMHDVRKLVHFCFSCRILGMGIENWLYEKLGKPEIQISGEVHSDLFAEKKVTWINQHVGGALLFAGECDDIPPEQTSQSVLQTLAPEIRLRGGCELDALSHYLQQDTPKLLIDANYASGGFLIRQDSSTNLALSCAPLNDAIKEEINLLGFKPKDFDGHIFASPPANTFFVISTWGDLYLPIYRHKTLGFDITVALRKGGLPDFTHTTSEQLVEFLKDTNLNEEEKMQVRRIVTHISANYTCVPLDEKILLRNWEMIFEKIPKNCLLVVLLPNTNRDAQTLVAFQYHMIIQELAKRFPNVVTLDITTYSQHYARDDAIDHLNRMVYFNLYKDLLLNFGQRMGAATPA